MTLIMNYTIFWNVTLFGVVEIYRPILVTRGLRQEMSSPPKILGSWVRIPFESLLSV
jgi:hypothetical protein